jgi:hypothetical protein
MHLNKFLIPPSLQCLLAQVGAGPADVEAVVGCSSQPSCVAAAATTLALDGSSSSHGSGNSVVGANCGAGNGADLPADASVAEAGEVSGCAVVSGWKRRYLYCQSVPFISPFIYTVLVIGSCSMTCGFGKSMLCRRFSGLRS